MAEDCSAIGDVSGHNTRMLYERAEAFHTGGDPYWRESAWFHFSVPERDLIGFVYFFYDPLTGLPGGVPAVWDRSGAEIYDCRFYDWRWLQPAVKSLDYRDFTLPNSLRRRVIEPLRRYRLSYDALGFALDLEWSALDGAARDSLRFQIDSERLAAFRSGWSLQRLDRARR